MKQLLAEKPTQKNPAQDPNRTPMSLSALWQLWKDNLKSWRQYREEHPDLFTLNLQAGVRHLAARCKEKYRELKIDSMIKTPLQPAEIKDIYCISSIK